MISSVTFPIVFKNCFYVLIFLLIFNANANAQNNFSKDSVDKKSAFLFQNKKWDELISFGNTALKRNAETYFLRVRLGMAYFEKENYFNAIPEFERAIEIGYQDENVLEYLYNSYLKTGRTEDAAYIFSSFSESGKNRIKPLNNSFAENIFTGIEYGFSNDESRNANTDLDGDQNKYGEQIIFRNSILATAGLNQLPFDRLNIFYDYTYINSGKTKIIMRNNEKLNDDYQEIQNRFYNRFDVLAANGLVISPAGHYISKKYNTLFTGIADSTLTDITVSEKEINNENFILSLSASKFYSIYKFTLSGSFSYLNEFHQSQLGLSFMMYPLRKTSFYTNTSAVLHSENKISNLIVSQSLGIKAGKRIYIEAFVSAGKMKNYNEQNGYTVYNTGDVIKTKFGISLDFSLLKNLNFNIGYSFRQSEKNYLTYKAKGLYRGVISYEQTLTKLNYNVSVITAQAKFIF
ncbi:MAG: tetratricopeptide repeat protein [Ignavibacteria bacterium]|nr:tetratricopeptide repeat protein [Ignavibacteria bacterium]